MPFGKYKGQEVADLDTGYLQWLKDNTRLYGALKEEVDKALSDTNTSNDIDDVELDEIVGEWPQCPIT